MEYPDIKHLYSYKKADEHTEQIFKDCKLWASKPEKFNDPFDCNLEVTSGITEEGLLCSIEKRYGPAKKWPVKISTWVNSWFGNDGIFTPTHRAYIDQAIQSEKDANQNSGVVCLSEVNDSILMWSHYAESHTGICIEFERTPESDLGDLAICAPIEYCATYPIIDFNEILSSPDGKTFNRMLRGKADCWAYEKEWRFILNQGGMHCKLVGKISKVIFGLRTPTAFKATIQALCDEQGIHTVQAVKAPMEFRIIIPA